MLESALFIRSRRWLLALAEGRVGPAQVTRQTKAEHDRTTVDSSQRLVATAITDVTGFYWFPPAGVLTRGVGYTVAVTGLPSPARTTPISQKFTWGGSRITFDNFVTN